MTPDEVRTLIQSSENFRETYLGSRESTLGVEENITIPDAARFMHVLNVGPTGYGKTQLMIHAALQDAYKGHGLCIVNPKGDAIDEYIAKLPKQRRDDIVYIDPGQDEITPINVLEPHIAEGMTSAQVENQKGIIVSDLIGLFRRYSENWGDRFGRVLETLLRAHIDLNIRGDSKTLLDVFRCVVDEDALTTLIDATGDQVVREQLVRVKEDMSSYEMEPLQRRLNDFVMNPTIRRFIAAEESGVDFQEAINNHQIILVDVQKGDVGDTVARLVGSIVVTKVWAAAQSRIAQPAEERTPFYLYVDELQNFAGEGSNFTTILSEAREYRLGCWLATQYFDQLARDMQRAVSNNCRTKIFFNPSGSEDLSFITSMLEGVEKPTLTALGKFRAVVQFPSERQHQPAITFDTYPPYQGAIDDTTIDQVKLDATYAKPMVDTSLTGSSLGRTAAAGKEQHMELLQAAQQYFTANGFTVNLLYQDGEEKPDGHLLLDDDVLHLEAESSTLSKPIRVLTNYHRACVADRDLVFVVKKGHAGKLDNILSDPVNRRGSDHEDDQGPYSYYVTSNGDEFTAIDELDHDYRIFEIRDADTADLVEYVPDTEMDCPELDAASADELGAFCQHRESDGFCTALGQECVLDYH